MNQGGHDLDKERSNSAGEGPTALSTMKCAVDPSLSTLDVSLSRTRSPCFAGRPASAIFRFSGFSSLNKFVKTRQMFLCVRKSDNNVKFKLIMNR